MGENEITNDIHITMLGNVVIVRANRLNARFAFQRFADGSFRLGDRIFRPAQEGSSAQWGRTGQGGGASGGKSWRPKRGSGNPGLPPRERLWWGGLAKERHDAALDFYLRPYKETLVRRPPAEQKEAGMNERRGLKSGKRRNFDE